jgi:hypothetical protein
MGGKSSPPPPDYSGLERVANRQLDFAERQYAEMKPFVSRLATTMADAQQQQMAQAQDYYNYQTQTFRPVEQGLVADAQRFSTEGYREQMARDAAAAASQAFATTQQASQRAMAARGVNPASGAGMALAQQSNLGLAAQRANAMTGARQQAEQMGWARRMDVTGLGRGLAGASTAAYAGATGAGQTAGNTMMSAGNQYMQGLQQGAGTLGTIASGQASIYNAAMQQQDPLAQIVGTGLGIYAGKVSDRRLKENIELVGKDERTGLNLYEFSYKKGSGKRYVGVMADEVEKLYPDAIFVMPDGFMAVNYTMLGIEMQEVAHG